MFYCSCRSFFRKVPLTIFSAVVKDIDLQESEKNDCRNPPFKFNKITNAAISTVKTPFVFVFIIQDYNSKF